MRFDVVIVLGMHRSGTSAFTKGLELFGVDLGQNLLAANEYNPKGYFEDNQLVTINDNILRKSELLWSTLQFIEPADLLGPRFQKEQNDAREFLKGKLAQGTPIGLKDPRLCRTLPLWEKIFVELEVRVGYVIVFRSPFEIAASLEKRDGMAFDYGLALWGSYQTDALRHTESKSRLFVGLHQLLENSERELTRISKFLETGWDLDAQSALEYEKKFLDSDLRHHQTEKRRALEPVALQALALALDAVCQKCDKKELEDVGNAAKEALLRMMQVSDLIRKNNQNLLRSNSSVELFYSKDLGAFSEERKFSKLLIITPGSQEVINVSLSGEVGLAPYWRLDPGCQPGMIHLLGMKFLDPKGHVVWDLQDHREQILVQGTAVQLPLPPVGVKLVSSGSDPSIILPALPGEALPVSSILVDIEFNSTQEEIGKLVQMQAQKAADFLQALGEKDSQVAQMKSILDKNEMKIAQIIKIDEKIEQIHQEMEQDRKESKLVVKKVEEERTISEKQNLSLQNTLNQIHQEMEQDRKESKLVVKKVEEERTISEKQNLSLQNTLNQIHQEMEQDRKESKLVVKKVEEERASSEKQNKSVQKTLNQIRQEMEQDRKESKLIVKKVEEERASSEKQSVSVQKTLNQIRQEMEQDRKESKLVVKKVEEEWTQQRKAQQEAVEKSVAEVKKEIVAEIQSLIANLVEQEEKNRLEVSARIDSVKEGIEGRISEVGEYAAKIQKAVVSPSSYLIPTPFSWYSFLYKMLSIRKPIWLNKEKESGEASKRPGFWRRLERGIRKRRKRWIGGVGFDRDWYLKEYPDIARAGIDPLDHYVRYGIKESRWKSRGHKEGNKKLSQKTTPWSFDRIRFNSSWYLNRYPDVAAAGIDAYWHYKNQGILEGRFKNRKEEEKASLVKSGIEQNNGIIRDLESQNKSSPEVLAISKSLHSYRPVQTDIRAIALYLPQYHAIPENDEWWGKGFTEWSNVRRGRPQYDGHYQPHIPHPDLGYYDLNDPSVMEKQAAMAKAAGIEGFCFYYYWFNGKRLLNMPTDRLLSTGKPDFPFCFCWANENWTRTWDGGDNQILMAQKHSVENDEGIIGDLLPAFRDHRYIRVAGKPLLVVYRPSLLPDIRHTTDRWREICRKEGIGEIHLAFMLGFERPEPTSIGFDSAIQMPPLGDPSPNLKNELEIKNPEKFTGEVRDYRRMHLNFNLNQISASTWPAVCPNWDNTARRMERAHSLIHASPEKYLTWLKEVVSFLRKDRPLGKRFVFINAWNEWGEGCHLEPDEKNGYAWLNATRLALTDTKPPEVPARLRVLVVGHDAARAGAQILLLTMLREWKNRDDVDFRLVLLSDGVLRSDFQKICPTMLLTDYPTEELRKKALQELDEFSPNVILANTVVSGSVLPTLKRFGVPIVSYIHELQKSIERWAPGKIMETLIANTDHFVAGAKAVGTNLNETHRVNPDDISTQESFIKTCKNVPLTNLNQIRKELGLRPSDKVVFGCGTMDWRKGPDIFAQTAERVLKNVPDAIFIWIGPSATDEFGRAAYAFAQEPRIRFIGEKENFFDYFLIGSAYFLSSREDPYPLVALEAADAGLPIVCFAEAGGIPDFVNNSCGRTVPPQDIEAAAQALTEILRDRDIQESLGEAARNSVRTKHDAVGSSEQVLSILKQVYCKKVKAPRECLENGSNPLVSVVVPNYNHAQFLPERITSIVNQTNSNIEIIFLDDKSTDESIEIIETFVARDDRGRVLKNDVNSGSSFKQWRKGLREARGKYVWIAESDDSADPELLQTLVARLEANDKAVLATCCPRMTSLEGNDLGIPRDWFADIGGKRWETDFSLTGQKMIAEILSKKNAILNASGVVFRNGPKLDELADDKMRLCGDWLFWVRLLARGDFEYVARPLNYWRLGSSNARTKPQGEIEWKEGKKVIREISDILGTADTARSELLATFKKRCVSWKATESHRKQKPKKPKYDLKNMSII